MGRYMEQEFFYKQSETGWEITGCNMLSAMVTLPKQYKGEKVVSIASHAFQECRGVFELKLPDDVTSIGSHAFFNCRNLNKITLSDNINSIGDGAFKNCEKLQSILIRSLTGRMTCMRSILSELPVQLKIQIIYPDAEAELVFPAFTFEFIENFEARLINQITYGSGVHYRECAVGSEFDYKKYDSIFSFAKANETKMVALSLALCRLQKPYQLEPESRQQYYDFFLENAIYAAEYFIKNGNYEVLMFLAEQEIFNRKSIEEVIDLAYQLDNPQIVGMLLQWKQKHFGKTEKRYNL